MLLPTHYATGSCAKQINGGNKQNDIGGIATLVTLCNLIHAKMQSLFVKDHMVI